MMAMERDYYRLPATSIGQQPAASEARGTVGEGGGRLRIRAVWVCFVKFRFGGYAHFQEDEAPVFVQVLAY
jgi:hypothetical protein